MKKYFGVVLFLIVTVIFLSGCFYDLVIPENDLNSEDTGDGVVPGKGTLKIYLTDAPGDYSEVNITIYKIQIHLAGEDEEDEGEWIECLTTQVTYNLIDLIYVSVLLSECELTSGKYTQIRLFITDPNILLNGGEEPITLIIPSADQTGIKLIHPFEIVDGGITVLTIDFDAEKSVIKTGNEKYIMKPVIHVTSETYSEGEEPPEGLGSVSGTVSYYYSQDSELTGIDGANIELTGGAYIFANTTTTLEDGSFSFALDSIPAGNYTLNVYTDDYGNYSEDIEVVAEGDTVVNIVFLSEKLGGISGSVVDSESGELIEGATVNVNLSGGVYTFNSSALTDVYGDFTITQLPVGTYTLTASAIAIGYDEYTESGIGVTADATTNIGVIGLEPLP